MSYHYISQLSHVELLSPRPDDTVRFFTDVLGLSESHRNGQSVWMRAWGEYFHHSLKVTEAAETGLGHVAWRVDGPDDLERAAGALADAGAPGTWTDGDEGHGTSYVFTMPGGHRFELVWDVERYIAPPELRSVYPDRPQRQATHGAPVRRIDHCTVLSPELEADKRVFIDALRFRHMDAIIAPNGQEAFVALTSGAQNHDYAIFKELHPAPGTGGRLHHMCYAYDTREELLRALDILAEHGFRLEDGPHKHGVGELFFAYVIEPGGTRVELQTGGVWNQIADWEPVRWRIEDGAGMAWQSGRPPSLEELQPARAGAGANHGQEMVTNG